MDVSYGHRFHRSIDHMAIDSIDYGSIDYGNIWKLLHFRRTPLFWVAPSSRCLLAGSLDLQDDHKPLGPCAQWYLGGEVQWLVAVFSIMQRFMHKNGHMNH